MARRAYLDALVEGIRSGRLDLGDLDDDIGERDAVRLADLCDELLRAESAHASRSVLQLIASLGQRRVAPPLVRGLSHPVASVRAACARALAGCAEDAALRSALADRDAAARLAAVAPDRVPAQTIARALGDPAADVRRRAAEVLASAGAAGVEAAVPYLADPSEPTAAAALEAVAAGVHPRRRHLLSTELRQRAGLAWHALAGLCFVPDDGAPDTRFVRAAVC